MLRLTLRSSRDGRFLCRIVDRGFPFVLDFGERAVIEDVGSKLLHGFTLYRNGQLEQVSTSDPDILPRLAEFYAKEGALVFLEEPTWAGRDHSLEDRLPGPQPPKAAVLPDLPPAPSDLGPDDRAEPPHNDDATELVEIGDLPDVDEYLELDLPDVGEEDLPTEAIALRARRPR